MRDTSDRLTYVTVRTANGRSEPLAQFVKFETVFEDGVRWRRNRFPAISVRADVADGMLAPDVAAQIIPQLKSIDEQLPAGYFIETGSMLAPDVAAQIIPQLKSIDEQLPAGYFIETGAAKE